MNVTLWSLQALLAVWYLIGGSFVLANYEKVRAAWTPGWPAAVFIAYGALQILFSLGMFFPKTARNAAIGLAVLALLGCALFAQYAGFPGVLWGIVPALLALFIAYGRTQLSPFKKA